MVNTPGSGRSGALLLIVVATSAAALLWWLGTPVSSADSAPRTDPAQSPPAAVRDDAAGSAAPRTASVDAPSAARQARRQPTDPVDVHLQVVDCRGAEQSGVQVHLDGAAGEHSGRTDAAGGVRFAAVHPGGYQVRVRGSQVLSHHGFRELGGAAAKVDWQVEVDCGARLLGRVVDVAGRPVAGARIVPLRAGPQTSEFARDCAVVTGDDGRFELVGARDAPTLVLVEHEGTPAVKRRLRAGSGLAVVQIGG